MIASANFESVSTMASIKEDKNSAYFQSLFRPNVCNTLICSITAWYEMENITEMYWTIWGLRHCKHSMDIALKYYWNENFLNDNANIYFWIMWMYPIVPLILNTTSCSPPSLLKLRGQVNSTNSGTANTADTSNVRSHDLSALLTSHLYSGRITESVPSNWRILLTGIADTILQFQYRYCQIHVYLIKKYFFKK